MMTAAVILVAAVAGPISTAAAVPPTPDYSPPLAEESPFSSADAFCTPDTTPKPVDVGASAPGIDRGRVSAVLVLPPAGKTATPAGQSIHGDASAQAAHYAELVDRCGGIHGRRLELRAVESSGDTATDCAAVTHGGTPFIVLASGQFDAAQCVAAQQHLIVVAPSASAPNAVLQTTHGLYAVGTSPEGVLETRVQDLVDHADLASHQFALVTTGTAPPLDDQLRTILAADRLRPALDAVTPVAGPRATAQAVVASKLPMVLTDTVDPTFLDALAKSPDPPSVYVFPPATATGDALMATLDPKTVGAVPVSTWTDPATAAGDEGLEPGAFAQMCDTALSEPVSAHTTTTTTTKPVVTTTAPPAGSSATTTSICLAVRLAARGLYLAGPNPSQRDAVRAFHNLPFVDDPAPSGAPVPRPNQLVNEPVRRGTGVLVRSRLTDPCPPKATHPGTAAGAAPCWVPTSGYDGGGRAVNAAIVAAPRVTSAH
jgi:hypothetical protein